MINQELMKFNLLNPILKNNIGKHKLNEYSINTSLAAKGPLAHRLQRLHHRTAAPPAKSKMAGRGPQNGRLGLEKCLPLGFWVF